VALLLSQLAGIPSLELDDGMAGTERFGEDDEGGLVEEEDFDIIWKNAIESELSDVSLDLVDGDMVDVLVTMEPEELVDDDVTEDGTRPFIIAAKKSSFDTPVVLGFSSMVS